MFFKRIYFEGAAGVDPFLCFLPCLWPFLALVAVLPVAPFRLPAGALVLPVPACPNARLPASNIVNTTVKSFFMHSPLREVQSYLIEHCGRKIVLGLRRREQLAIGT